MDEDLSIEEYVALYQKKFGEPPTYMIGTDDEWYNEHIKNAVKTGKPFNPSDAFEDEFMSDEKEKIVI